MYMEYGSGELHLNYVIRVVVELQLRRPPNQRLKINQTEVVQFQPDHGGHG